MLNARWVGQDQIDRGVGLAEVPGAEAAVEPWVAPLIGGAEMRPWWRQSMRDRDDLGGGVPDSDSPRIEVGAAAVVGRGRILGIDAQAVSELAGIHALVRLEVLIDGQNLVSLAGDRPDG